MKNILAWLLLALLAVAPARGAWAHSADYAPPAVHTAHCLMPAAPAVPAAALGAVGEMPHTGAEMARDPDGVIRAVKRAVATQRCALRGECFVCPLNGARCHHGRGGCCMKKCGPDTGGESVHAVVDIAVYLQNVNATRPLFRNAGHVASAPRTLRSWTDCPDPRPPAS